MNTAASLLRRKATRAIYSIGPDEPVLEAIRRMSEHSIGALVVLRGEQLVGIVSERDYARKVILMGRSSNDTPVRQIMTTAVQTVSPAQSVRECMEIVTHRRFRHLPVVDDGRLVGVLSIGDLVSAVLEEQRETIEQLEQYIHS